MAHRIGRIGTGAALSLVVLTLIVGIGQLFDKNRVIEDHAGQRIQHGAAAVTAYLEREGLHRPLIDITHPIWGDAAGIILILKKSGRPAAVDPSWVFMFGPWFAPTGTEDCGLVFADPDRRRWLIQDSRYTTIMESSELSIHAAKPLLSAH